MVRAMRIAWCVLVAAGCGTQSSDPFLLDSADCALVNNFKVDGTATAWTDCRVYWSAVPYQTLTVELTIPNTTGSFLAPAAGWMRASAHVPGELDTDLTTIAFEPSNALPSAVPDDKIALDLSLPACGNLGAMMKTVDTMADVGADSVSFSMSLSGTCGQSMYTGGFILTAAAKAGSVTTTDPATPVTPTE